MNLRGTLNKAISSIIEIIDIDGHLSQEDKERMTISLSDFCINATKKFIAGQKKHGGKITDKDLRHELRQEYLDSFWYIEAEDWRLKNENKSNSKENKETEKINTSEVECQ